MGSYDNTDISYKAAGAETYHLPILYTEDERSSYAAWGIKKEKLLMPFAIVTIIIDAFVLCATVVYLFEVQRQKPAFSVWLSCWGGVVGDVSYGVALVLTVLILKPLDWLFDKIMHRPEQPKMLQVTPKETGVSYLILRGTTVLAQGLLPWNAWEAALAVETNEILLEGQRLRIGSNTIASIYPPEKQKPWMDHPAEQITGTISLAHIRKNMQGYLASLEEQKREAEWRRQNP